MLQTKMMYFRVRISPCQKLQVKLFVIYFSGNNQKHFFSILHLSSACEKSPELCVRGIELNVLQLFISFVFV